MADSRTTFGLTDKVVIVTGGTGGIGEYVVRALAKHGASVVIVGRSKNKTENLAESVVAAGGQAVGVTADVTGADARDRVVTTAIDRFGRLDVLVNNAGITRRSAAADITEELYDSVHDINAKSAFFLSQRAYPHLRDAGNSSIINLVSIGLWVSGPGSLLYRSSKASMQAVTMILAKEWATDGVRVNAIAPGAMEIGMGASTPADRIENLLNGTPMGRLGRGDEVASAVLYLASDLASYTTGTTLRVDGGAVSL